MLKAMEIIDIRLPLLDYVVAQKSRIFNLDKVEKFPLQVKLGA